MDESLGGFVTDEGIISERLWLISDGLSSARFWDLLGYFLWKRFPFRFRDLDPKNLRRLVIRVEVVNELLLSKSKLSIDWEITVKDLSEIWVNPWRLWGNSSAPGEIETFSSSSPVSTKLALRIWKAVWIEFRVRHLSSRINR